VKVVKLNRNYNGYGVFSHRVEFFSPGTTIQDRRRQYLRVREWLWSGFGPSAEQEIAREAYFGHTPKWAWCAEKFVVYLRDEAYTAFMLRKEFWENVENL
jgi:hypothetical protein